jgi:hypothetical protein
MNIVENLQIRKPFAFLSAQIEADFPEFPSTNHEFFLMRDGFNPQWGLPDRLREAALALKMSNALRIYDGLHMSGVTNKYEFTAKMVEEFFEEKELHVNKNQVYAAVKVPEFFVHVRTVKRGKGGGAGSSTNWYRIATFAEVAGAFGISDPADDTSPLSKADLESPSTYRAGLQRGFQERDPRVSRDALSRRLNVSKATTRQYDFWNGTKIEFQFEFHEVWRYENWDDVLKEFIAKKDRRFFLHIDPNDGKKPFAAPLDLMIARVNARAGKLVDVVEQTTNHYTVNARHQRLYDPLGLPY